ncbi:hypothetical protein E2C01_058831 [Portunus trituberculatus]|uniref:Diacylglycerol O-acyltransferase n=1 Tax=Portunus trituberculatus TaxID=210409 RepID=A0A5B7GWK8_PORTR|nr:hypothetical protein [Portunus trituberculatus]
MLDNATRSLNGPFHPLALPPKSTTFSWLEIVAQHEFLLLPALQNMSLALLVLLVPQVSTGNPKKLLSPLKRLLARVFFFHLLFNTVKAIVGVVLMMAMLPMLSVMVFFWMTSILVRLCYAILWGPCVKKAEGLDCVWGVEEKENKPFITVCLRVHGVTDLQAVQRAIFTKIVQVRDDSGEYKYKKFRQLFSQRFGYYCWRDDSHFDINNHVRELKLSSLLPPFEDAEGEHEAAAGEERHKDNDDATDEMVQRYVSEELTKAMPEDKPQWEVLLVDRGDGRYNVLLRLHHAIGDGVTLVKNEASTTVNDVLMTCLSAALAKHFTRR